MFAPRVHKPPVPIEHWPLLGGVQRVDRRSCLELGPSSEVPELVPRLIEPDEPLLWKVQASWLGDAQEQRRRASVDNIRRVCR